MSGPADPFGIVVVDSDLTRLTFRRRARRDLAAQLRPGEEPKRLVMVAALWALEFDGVATLIGGSTSGSTIGPILLLTDQRLILCIGRSGLFTTSVSYRAFELSAIASVRGADNGFEIHFRDGSGYRFHSYVKNPRSIRFVGAMEADLLRVVPRG